MSGAGGGGEEEGKGERSKGNYQTGPRITQRSNRARARSRMEEKLEARDGLAQRNRGKGSAAHGDHLARLEKRIA